MAGLVPYACWVLGLLASAAAAEPPKHWGQPRFSGKAVMVTGGDSGIGLAAVEAFYFECGSVMMVGHNPAKTKDAWGNLSALPPPAGCPTPPKLLWAAIDISDAGAVKAVIEQAVAGLGGLDVAVNNAGSAGGFEFKQIGDPDFMEYFDHSPEMSINVHGTLNCMNAQLQHWTSKGLTGTIVNVASVCGESAWCAATYSTSKWAMIGFSKQAALKYAGSGIRVNVLAPGLVETPMLRNGLGPYDPRWLVKKMVMEAPIPQKHIAQPWEMAGPITFLASDMSSYLSGHVLTADGGISDQSPYHLPFTTEDAAPAKVPPAAEMADLLV